ncbi:MAG: hypothetical protein JXA99_16990 [Candidatus Lokiarchaeota archaeon]|nr:hypothetical protein [Candidatus Lokiarchaeota archaeon]
MKLDRLKYSITTITGISLIISYVTFTIFSILLYRENWTPIITRISDLGSIDYGNTPLGAFLFNLGAIITGFLLYPFYLGLCIWYKNLKEEKKRKLLIITLLCGCLSATCLILLGVFPIHTDLIHIFWASGFFLLYQLVSILIGISLRSHEKFMKIIAYYGWSIGIVNFLFIVTQAPILEWLSVLSALPLVGLLAYNTYKSYLPN